MQFATRRVEVHGEYGLVRRVHPQAARSMILGGQARKVDARSIRLCSGLSTLPRNEREVSRLSSNSNKTTREQRLDCGARLIQHKRIEDGSLYGLRA